MSVRSNLKDWALDTSVGRLVLTLVAGCLALFLYVGVVRSMQSVSEWRKNNPASFDFPTVQVGEFSVKDLGVVEGKLYRLPQRITDDLTALTVEIPWGRKLVYFQGAIKADVGDCVVFHSYIATNAAGSQYFDIVTNTYPGPGDCKSK